MCLELCNGTAETIQRDLQSLIDHKDIISMVSFEGYRMWMVSCSVIPRLCLCQTECCWLPVVANDFIVRQFYSQKVHSRFADVIFFRWISGSRILPNSLIGCVQFSKTPNRSSLKPSKCSFGRIFFFFVFLLSFVECLAIYRCVPFILSLL